MSLTEEQITAQNFQDFYTKIRPFLNGSYPTPIVNKFSKGDLYSTEEKIIGQWVDGKPLYQKTFTGLSFSLINGWSNTGISSTSLDIDSIIRGNAIILVGTDKTAVSVATRIQGNIISIFVESLQGSAVTDLTFQYTKTTDSPISIGDGNDYSTDEQVVGTWIDGKPVYQKTVTGTMPAQNQDTMINVSSLNIKLCLSCVGAIYDYMTQPLSPYSGSAGLLTFYNTSNGIYLRNSLDNNASGKTCYVTICYTKTND